jgi:2-isopropylmalate synthase
VTTAEDGVTELTVDYRIADDAARLVATGNGPIDAFINGLNANGYAVTLYDYVEHAMSAGGHAVAAAYVDLEVGGRRLWGVGIDPDRNHAAFLAVLSSLNRTARARTPELLLTVA